MVFAFVTPTPALASGFTGSSVSASSARGPVSTAPFAVARASLSDAASKAQAGLALGLAAAALVAVPATSNALTQADINQLTYSQVKGTGVANRCPEVEGAKGTIVLDSGKSYKLADLCLEPKSFQVEEETENKRKGETKKAFIDTKLMTRATYTLTGIEGDLKVDGSGITFEEKDGIDYAATTVQLPGGERVPFLFTVKGLVAKAAGSTISTSTEFGGDFRVPSYRSGLFLDPKGRGGVTGYDMAVALPAMQADGAEGQDEIEKETNKVFQVTDGAIEMAVQRIDPVSGEIAGVFVSEQLSDTDMGSKAPKKVLLKGVWYGRVDEA
jgi:photosystem II oxygen-evolving enhancer protein 1